MLENEWMVEVMGKGINYRNVQDPWEGNYKMSLNGINKDLS